MSSKNRIWTALFLVAGCNWGVTVTRAFCVTPTSPLRKAFTTDRRLEYHVGLSSRVSRVERHRSWSASASSSKSITLHQGREDEAEPSLTQVAKKAISPASEFGTPLPESASNFNKAAVGIIKNAVFDILFAGDSLDRSYARFYALETIARMPYFSYLSVLHLYETLGRWRRAEYMKIHFAESWNELHHLLIMEELGGNARFQDRFVAQHVAFGYYWFVVAAYLFNPILAYNLNEAVEEHAFETYDKFVEQYGDTLEQLEAPQVAKDYYSEGDLYMFDAMHSHQTSSSSCESDLRRRPKCETLRDVFINIRDDEAEHVRTMAYLQKTDSDLLDSGDDLCEIIDDDITPETAVLDIVSNGSNATTMHDVVS
eukprot:scaffold43225_cov59-Attheya_sp.AAC.2